MNVVVFGIAAVVMGVLAGWFGLTALAFAVGHLWFDALAYGVLTISSILLACVYSALLAVEWLKDRF